MDHRDLSRCYLGSYLSEIDALEETRFFLYPVVAMSATPVKTDSTNFEIRMSGTKYRGYCEFKYLQAVGKRDVGPPVDLYIDRLDKPVTGASKPAGDYDIGLWRVWPTTGIVSFKVYVHHICQDTPRNTEIASCVVDNEMKEGLRCSHWWNYLFNKALAYLETPYSQKVRQLFRISLE